MEHPPLSPILNMRTEIPVSHLWFQTVANFKINNEQIISPKQNYEKIKT